MQIQRVQNNNYNISFGERLVFDSKLITRASKKEKLEMVIIKNMFKNNGRDGKIQVKNNNKISVKEIIENLRSNLTLAR